MASVNGNSMQGDMNENLAETCFSDRKLIKEKFVIEAANDDSALLTGDDETESTIKQNLDD